MLKSVQNLSLTPVQFYILLAVIGRPLHGYAIRDQVAFDSRSQIIVPMGTIYPALKRMVAAGLLMGLPPAALARPGGPPAGQRYIITKYGRRRLEAECRRLELAATQARYKLGQKV